MKISIGCDHSALELKNNIIEHLKACGHEVIDRGTYTKDSCDYTDYGYMVAKDIQSKTVDRGIVICFTGIGMSMACNRIKGARCARVCTPYDAKWTRFDNDANIISFSATLRKYKIYDILDTFFSTEASNEERHVRRRRMLDEDWHG